MMRTTTTIQGVRAGITVVLAVFLLLTPITSLAQEATPAATDTVAAQVAPEPGSLQITLTGSTGLALSGSVAVTDSAGVYQEVWISEGFGQVASLAAGTATVTQITGTTDYAVNATPKYIEIPEGGVGYATITNAFLDADGDGMGDSVDTCPAGNNALDTDGDGIADACDDTPNGDPTPSPTAEPTATATVAPTATASATAASTPIAGMTSRANAAAPASASNQVASCSLRSATNTTTLGGYVMYHCWTNGSQLSVEIDMKANTWQLAYVLSDSADLQPSDFTFESLPWKPGDSADLPKTDTGALQNVYIFVTPMENAEIGRWGAWPQFDVHLWNPNIDSNFLHHSYFQFFRDIDPNDFSLTCSPAEVAPSAQATATVTCQVDVVTLSATQEATVTIQAPDSSGWKVSAPSWLLTGKATSGSPFKVTFTVEPAGGTPGATQTVLVKSTVSVANERATGPTGSFTIRGASTPTFTTRVIGSNLEWTGTYSFETRTCDLGSLTYQVTYGGSSSNGWNVQVSATDFTRAGDDSSIPKANLRLTGSSDPGVAALSRPATSGSLGTPVRVLRATAAVPAGTYEQTLDLSLDIPGGALVGTYSSHITITAATGP